MAYINKKTRIKVWEKYDHHCSYCGTVLRYNQLQVDHIKAYWHNDSYESALKYGIKKGKHSIENFNPSCARCNRWKSTFSIEQFRAEIQQQLTRLKRDSSNYRMALDYGMVAENNKPVVFYFETYKAI